MYKRKPKDDLLSRAYAVPTAWQIMQSHVNDNTPSFFYWFTRISLGSLGGAILVSLFSMVL